jgi:galactokinase/mevalonate kinase-like predicted kinase
LKLLAKAIGVSYDVQQREGMEALPAVSGSIAAKYLGAGYGGYALYLFDDIAKRDAAKSVNAHAMSVEPHIRMA